MKRILAIVSLLVSPAALATTYPMGISFSPPVAGPGRYVTATISGLAKNPSITVNSVTINGSTIVIDAVTSAPGPICGPACIYSTQANFNAPMQPGVYNVEYWLTFAGTRSIAAKAQLTVANICDFGHSLTVDHHSVYLHGAVELSFCYPGYSGIDFGYYVHSFSVYTAQSPDGPFSLLTADVPGNTEGPTVTVTPTALGTTYYYVESHGCQGVITLCANGGLPDTVMTTNIVAVQTSLAGGCLADDTTLCVSGGRFSVKARWTTPSGVSGDGQAVSLTKDSGYFWFFNSGNVEVTAKVLNACSLTPPAFWIFASGMTNVQVELTVTDTQSKVTKKYTNPMGSTFATIVDTNSFFCP